MLLKRGLLLLLNLSFIWIPFSGRSQVDSTVTITNKQAQFFIQWHLRAKSLMADTSILNKQIKALSGTIELKDGQLKNDSLMFIQKDGIAKTYKDNYDTLYKDYNKGQKKLKFFKNTTVIFLSTTVLLGALFVLVNK